MAAGASEKLWSVADLAEMVDDDAEAGQARAVQEASGSVIDIAASLEALAREHLSHMATLPWSVYAEAIAKRSPLPAGETFGCEIEGDYFDVGDLHTGPIYPKATLS